MSGTEDILLHFYRESPFSQKLSWLLNFKKVEYKVVTVPRLEPRPLRRPLDGGYRKTPILQIGNHVYCDTKAAILALEKSFPEPSFFPKLNGSDESSQGLARAFTMWIDNTLFSNVVSQLPFDKFDDAFIQDRSALVGRKFDPATMVAGAPFMKNALQAEFAIAKQTLGSKNWILNTDTLSLADISLAMVTFFLVNSVGEKWAQENLKVEFEHMQKTLGAVDWDRAESMPKLTEEEAIEVLKRYQDKEVDADFKVHQTVLPIKLGQQVYITPLDTGKVPVGGELVRSTVEETVIIHKDTTYNTSVYIHFPAVGFVVVPNVQAK